MKRSFSSAILCGVFFVACSSTETAVPGTAQRTEGESRSSMRLPSSLEAKQLVPQGSIEVGALAVVSDEAHTLAPSYVGGTDSLSALIHYPPIAKKAGVEGTVVVEFVVRTEGVAVDVAVVEGIGAGADEEVIRAVRMTKFYAAKNGSELVDVRVRLPVRFWLAR